VTQVTAQGVKVFQLSRAAPVKCGDGPKFIEIYYPMPQVSTPKIWLKSDKVNFATCKGDIYGIQMSLPEIKVIGS
jgi:hypothetical protein